MLVIRKLPLKSLLSIRIELYVNLFRGVSVCECVCFWGCVSMFMGVCVCVLSLGIWWSDDSKWEIQRKKRLMGQRPTSVINFLTK